MQPAERRILISELRDLSRTNVLRTDEEARNARERVAQICQLLGIEYADEVL